MISCGAMPWRAQSLSDSGLLYMITYTRVNIGWKCRVMMMEISSLSWSGRKLRTRRHARSSRAIKFHVSYRVYNDALVWIVSLCVFGFMKWGTYHGFTSLISTEVAFEQQQTNSYTAHVWEEIADECQSIGGVVDIALPCGLFSTGILLRSRKNTNSVRVKGWV
jgi:hypothetical protein